MNYAKIIADSISHDGIRLTTMEVSFHRFVLAEFNTHRVFSRNSASSRAIPVEKQIAKIREDIAMPVEFGSNKSGMQAGPPLDGFELDIAEAYWESASNQAIEQASRLMNLNVHKQVTNRLLEPFMWHTVIVTSVDYDNFFAQRCSPLAQPEIRVAAELMRDAYDDSRPKLLEYGEWHLPYILPEEYDQYDVVTLCQISAARCARVSYLTQDGVRDIEKDIKMFQRLVTADPPHWSPLEHVATPYIIGEHIPAGNFIEFVEYAPQVWYPEGWSQLRHNSFLLEE